MHLPFKTSSFPSDPAAKFCSRIRGVPIEVESELQALISQSHRMALGKELSSNTNDDGNFDGNVTTVDDKSITDEIHGEQINNMF